MGPGCECVQGYMCALVHMYIFLNFWSLHPPKPNRHLFSHCWPYALLSGGETRDGTGASMPICSSAPREEPTFQTNSRKEPTFQTNSFPNSDTGFQKLDLHVYIALGEH